MESNCNVLNCLHRVTIFFKFLPVISCTFRAFSWHLRFLIVDPQKYYFKPQIEGLFWNYCQQYGIRQCTMMLITSSLPLLGCLWNAYYCNYLGPTSDQSDSFYSLNSIYSLSFHFQWSSSGLRASRCGCVLPSSTTIPHWRITVNLVLPVQQENFSSVHSAISCPVPFESKTLPGDCF